MRRAMVTPTFAAGLGIVVAAVLVYPMTRTVFRYSGPEWGGISCPVAGCKSPSQDGSLASAKPGQKLAPPSPAPSPSAPPRPTPSASGQSSPSPPPAAPVVSYQTAHQWDSGFQEVITISFGQAPVPSHWGLWFSYPQTDHIVGVWGGRWAPHGGGTAVVTDPGRGAPPPQGDSIQVYVAVAGRPGPPSGCSFDHQPCRTG